ncbi:kinase-like domain-containing protein, partial [Auriculariales sp. MPI-PUGE-AT-0066]
MAVENPRPVQESPQTTFDLTFFTLAHSHYNFVVERISGGHVNETARVRATAKSHSHGDQCGQCYLGHPLAPPSTFIAKHAPSILQYPGPAISFNPVRLLVEARALHLFEANSASGLPKDSRLARLHHHPEISVPIPLQYSNKAHILLQSDLGEHVGFLGWMCDTLTPPTDDKLRRTAAALGHFLGTIHAVTYNLPRNLADEMRRHFANADANRVLYERTVRPLRNLLRACNVGECSSGSIFNTESLCDTLETRWLEFDQGGTQAPAAFNHGDMWHANVFPLSQGTASDPSQPARGPVLAVIDWEFAGMNRVGLDLARFTAFLYLFTQSTKLSDEVKRRVKIFMNLLVESFVEKFPQISAERKSFAMLYGLHTCNGATWHPGCDCNAGRS